MKKEYFKPEVATVEISLVDNLMQVSGFDTSMGDGPGFHPGQAPARRITVLGSISGGAGIGSLGSIGHIK